MRPDEYTPQAAIAAKACPECGQDSYYCEHGYLWPCGCLRNDAGAHRVGCPDHPEGVRGR